MATKRRSPQYSIALKPELQQILDTAVERTGLPKASLLYQATYTGLQRILASQDQLTDISTQPLSHTLFYIGRQMYRDRQPMPDDRVLMLGWRFERDMQVELDERLMLVNSLSNLEDV